jgi:hypothetical protein
MQILVMRKKAKMQNGENSLSLPRSEIFSNELIKTAIVDRLMDYQKQQGLSSQSLALQILSKVMESEITDPAKLPLSARDAKQLLHQGLQKRFSFINNSKNILAELGNGVAGFENDNHLGWELAIPAQLIRLSHDEIHDAKVKIIFSATENLTGLMQVRERILPKIAYCFLSNWYGESITDADINGIIHDDTKPPSERKMTDISKQAMVIRGIITSYLAGSQSKNGDLPFPFNIDDQTLEIISRITSSRRLDFAGNSVTKEELNTRVSEIIVNNQLLQSDLSDTELKQAERLLYDYGEQIFKIISNYDRTQKSGSKAVIYWKNKNLRLKGLPFEQFFANQQFVFGQDNLDAAIKNGIPHLWKYAVRFGSIAVPSRDDLQTGLKLLKIGKTGNSKELIVRLSEAESAWDKYEKHHQPGWIHTRANIIKETDRKNLLIRELDLKLDGALQIKPESVSQYHKNLGLRNNLRNRIYYYRNILVKNDSVDQTPRPDQLEFSAAEIESLHKSIRILSEIRMNEASRAINSDLHDIYGKSVERTDPDYTRKIANYQMQLYRDLDRTNCIINLMGSNNAVFFTAPGDQDILTLALSRLERNAISLPNDNDFRKSQLAYIEGVKNAVRNGSVAEPDNQTNIRNLLQRFRRDLDELREKIDSYITGSNHLSAVTRPESCTLDQLTRMADGETEGVFSDLISNRVALRGSGGQKKQISPTAYLEAKMLSKALKRNLTGFYRIRMSDALPVLSAGKAGPEPETILVQRHNGIYENPILEFMTGYSYFNEALKNQLSELINLIDGKSMLIKYETQMTEIESRLKVLAVENQYYLWWQKRTELADEVFKAQQMLDSDEKLFLDKMSELGLAVAADKLKLT